MGNANGTLVNLAERVHFLLVLPTATSNVARPGLDEVHIVLPNFARLFIKTNVLQGDIIRLIYNLARVARNIGGKIIVTANVIQVH